MSKKFKQAAKLHIGDKFLYAQALVEVCAIGTLRGYVLARRGGTPRRVVEYVRVVAVLRLPSGQHFELHVKPHQKFALPKGGAK